MSTPDTLSLALVQMTSVQGDPEGNCRKIIDIIRSSGADIVCFPEASLTGYTFDSPERYALRKDDPLIGMICEASSEDHVVAVFGFIEEHEGNVMVTQAVAQNGNAAFYRKTHLGLREREIFAAGNVIEPIRTERISIGIQLCWESHFPEISATLALKGAKIILMPFASPLNAEKRVDNWKRYLPARAYDNRVPVAACNSVDGGRGGGAIAIDTDGNVIAESRIQGENILRTNICLSNDIFHGSTMGGRDFLASRRPELYRL